MKNQIPNNGESKKLKVPNDVPASPDEKGTKGWIPKGEILEFAGRKIPGMVYFGNPEELNCSEQERQEFFSFFIDPTKPVSEKGGREFDKSLRSHDYGRMKPECRANFLDWLEGGKNDPSCSIHYPMLYCIGLEHRFFNSIPDEKENSWIIEEIEQLFGIYGWDSSIERVVRQFPTGMVDSPYAKEPEAFYDNFHYKGVLFDPDEGFEENPECLKYLKTIIKCGEKSEKGAPLDAEDLYPILKNSPLDKFGIEVSEIPRFKDLFEIRLKQKHPDGFALRIENRDLAKALKSLKLKSKFPRVWVDFKLTSDTDGLFELAEGVCEELKRHTGFIENNPGKENCFDALKLLPTVLWEDVGRYWDDIIGRYDKFLAWAQKQADHGTAITAEKVVEDMNLSITFKETDRIKWFELGYILRAFGFGIAPDYFLRYRVERRNDPIMIYKLDSRASQLSPENDSYVYALIRISIGAHVLHAVRKSAEETARILTEMVIQKEEFTNDQRKGLEANLKCILTLPNDHNFMKQWRAGFRKDCKEDLPNFLVKLAHSDSEIQEKGIAAIEEVYEKLGLESGMALSDIQGGRKVAN